MKPQSNPKTEIALAEALGVDRSTLWRWRRIGGPPGNDLATWRKWIASRQPDPKHAETRSLLQARWMLRRCELAEHELAVAQGKYLSADAVRADVTAIVQRAKAVLLAMPCALAPVLVGLTVPEIETKIKAAVWDALNQLHTGEIKPNSEPTPEVKP